MNVKSYGGTASIANNNQHSIDIITREKRLRRNCSTAELVGRGGGR